MSDLVERRQRIYAWANGDPMLLSAYAAKAEERIGSLIAALNRAGDQLAGVQPAIDIDCTWALGIVPQAQGEIVAELAKPDPGELFVAAPPEVSS